MVKQYDFISSDTHLEVLPERWTGRVLGVEHIIFATDFPHIECEWPNTKPALDSLSTGLSPEEKYKIVAGNVIDYFDLDPAILNKPE
jgi:hypothetical protein